MLSEKHRQWSAELRAVQDAQERLALLVARAKKAPPYPETLRTPEHQIPGCLSKLWFAASLDQGVCTFRCDSDSAIVKGIATLWCEFFTGATPQEVVSYQGDFLAEAGIQQHLSPNRRSGLGKLTERIRAFAAAHS